MKKIFMVVFVGALIISGCLASTTTTTTTTTLTTAATVTTFAVRETTTTLGLASPLPSKVEDCGKLAGDDEKTRCIIRFAVKQNDASICERISGAYHGGEAAAYCKIILANASSMCRVLADSLDKDECYARLGMLFLDASYCGLISDKTSSTTCYSYVGIAKKDASVCDKIGDEAEKTFCVAVAGNNPQLCDKLGSRKEECYLRISTEWGAASLCRKLADDANRIRCFWDTAVKTGDPSVCDIVDSNIKDKCYGYVAAELGSPSICGNIIGDDIRNTCYFNTGDCEKIDGMVEGATPEEEDGTDRCYVMLARKTGNPLLCEKIEDTNLKYECYHYVALKTGDETQCEMIKTTSLRKKCYDQMAYVKGPEQPLE